MRSQTEDPRGNTFMKEVLEEFYAKNVKTDEMDAAKELMKAQELKKNYLKTNAVTNQEWEPDAADGKLSHSKMVYEWNRRHFVEILPNQDGFAKQHSCCTSTGWFNCFTRKKKIAVDEDIQAMKKTYHKLGLGVDMYFKQIKSLVCLFAILAILSVPSCVAYYYAGEGHEINDSKTAFSTFTLGNIGQSENICNQAKYDEPELNLFCGFGVADKMTGLVLTDMSNQECYADNAKNLKFKKECDLSSSSYH